MWSKKKRIPIEKIEGVERGDRLDSPIPTMVTKVFVVHQIVACLAREIDKGGRPQIHKECLGWQGLIMLSPISNI
jgi:hypothetical protein